MWRGLWAPEGRVIWVWVADLTAVSCPRGLWSWNQRDKGPLPTCAPFTQLLPAVIQLVRKLVRN